MSDWVSGTVIDVSKWQDSLPDLSGVIGVIARAGIGTKPDAMFTSHIANARKAGKWVGAYWYNWGDLSVSDQVNAFIAREKEVGGVSLHVIDWEGAEGFSAAQTADFIRLYRSRTGNPIALYASESKFRDLGQDWNWIANYSNEPSKQYDMWQYGPFRGVDGNHARRRILDLVGATMPQADITSQVPATADFALDTQLFDLDGKTPVRKLGKALNDRFSPYAVGTKRAIYAADTDGVGAILYLAVPVAGSVKPIPAPEPVDLTQYVAKATYDADLAAAIEQLNAADAARVLAEQAAAEAALTEQNRIAAAEAARIRAI